MENTFMVVAAHPDDETLGCGATIAKLVKLGWEGIIILMSRGGMARGKSFAPELKKVEENCIKACEILGVTEIRWNDLPDNKFDSVPMLEIAKLVEKEINICKPRIVFTHYFGDLNIDHRKIFEAVLTASRPQPGFHNQDIYSFYIPSSTDWGDGIYFREFVPNVFCDVKTTVNDKMRALACYETEMRPSPHSRSMESLKRSLESWGNRVGLEYVEPFYHVRSFIFEK